MGRPAYKFFAWGMVALYGAGIGFTTWLEQSAGIGDASLSDKLPLLLGFGWFVILGSLIIARQPRNSMGWIFAAIGLMISLFSMGDVYASAVAVRRGELSLPVALAAWPNNWYWFLLLSLIFIYIPLLFPDGRLPSRRWRPVAWIGGITTAIICLIGAAGEEISLQSGMTIHNPIGVAGLGQVEELPIFALLTAVLGVAILGSVASVVVRFRRSRGDERQQLKWFVFAVCLLPLALFVDLLSPLLPTSDLIGNVVFALVLNALPIAIGIAILKYRLYEIDRIINRTAVYAVVSVVLVGGYLGSVLVIQTLLRPFTPGSNLAVVASTLGVAALFNPLRGRVQAFIDRRFYRRKYDARRTVESFGSRLREEIELNELTHDLGKVISETVEPSYVSLWLSRVERT